MKKRTDRRMTDAAESEEIRAWRAFAEQEEKAIRDKARRRRRVKAERRYQ